MSASYETSFDWLDQNDIITVPRIIDSPLLEIAKDGELKSDDFRAAGNYNLLWSITFPN